MLYIEKEDVRNLILKGNIGLEKENLRVDNEGYLSQTAHPFPDDENIVRDFCENQVEVNTRVFKTTEEAIDDLKKYTIKIQKSLSELEQPEYLWPFSNPPYIKNEDNIPIAIFNGIETGKTKYREYLASRYGRYKMTLSGIHFNYSFDEELLKQNFKYSDETDYQTYKDEIYLSLAENLVSYGWLITALTAASPLMDGTYVEKKQYDSDIFHGMASVRCSELGYWNYFPPILDYTTVSKYAESIEKYVSGGWIKYPSELYYPIRLKPKGENNLDNLKKHGINHIELRMIDLNPFEKCGLDLRDAGFIKLYLIWMASIKRKKIGEREQVQAVQNFKNAAHYDLKTVSIILDNGTSVPVADAGIFIIERMKKFYQDFDENVKSILNYQEEKLADPDKRYAWRVRKEFSGGFVKKGLVHAKNQQKEILNN